MAAGGRLVGGRWADGGRPVDGRGRVRRACRQGCGMGMDFLYNGSRVWGGERELESGHGLRAGCLKKKGKVLDCHTFGVKKKKKKTDNLDEIGRKLRPRALNRSKKMQKAGANSFPKSSA